MSQSLLSAGVCCFLTHVPRGNVQPRFSSQVQGAAYDFGKVPLLSSLGLRVGRVLQRAIAAAGAVSPRRGVGQAVRRWWCLQSAQPERPTKPRATSENKMQVPRALLKAMFFMNWTQQQVVEISSSPSHLPLPPECRPVIKCCSSSPSHTARS